MKHTKLARDVQFKVSPISVIKIRNITTKLKYS